MWIISFLRTCSALILTILLANPTTEIRAAPLPASIPTKTSNFDPGSLQEIAKRSDDDVVVVALHLNKFILSNGFIAYRDGDNYWVPLGAIPQALEFPIKVDASKGRAKGWFLSDNRKCE